MIQANELRIGNLINHYEEDYGFNYVEIGLYELDKIENKKTNVSDYYQPIQLTEEILLKCGFDKDLKYNYIVIDNSKFMFAIEWFDDAVHFIYESFAERMDKIKYVHQLQNLYFALTTEELEINL